MMFKVKSKIWMFVLKCLLWELFSLCDWHAPGPALRGLEEPAAHPTF